MGVGELALHQLGENAAAAVRGQHPNGHHARGRYLRTTGDRGLEEVSAGAPHDRTVVEGSVNPLCGEDLPEELDVLLGRATAEVVPDGVERAADLLGCANL